MTDREARREDIDLEALTQKWAANSSLICPLEDGMALIAAVEALREQVGELEADFKQMSEQYGAANKFMAEFMEERDAANALNKEMADVLEKFTDYFGAEWDNEYARPEVTDFFAKARAALKKARP